MPRDISTELNSATSQRVTSLGWLVYIGFSTPLRLATFGDTSFNGEIWLYADVEVTSLTTDSVGGGTATIKLGNKNNEMSAYILNEGVDGKKVEIYKAYYDDAGSLVGTKGLFRGIGNEADLSAISSVLIKATSADTKSLFSPRFRVCEANGFKHLLQAGTVLTWGNNTIILE